MTQFDQPGTHPTPKLMGRLTRLAAGVGILWMTFGSTLPYIQPFTRVREGWGVPGWGWVPGALLALYLLPVIVDRGLGISWGGRSQLVVAALGAAAIVADFILYGSLWGPPLGWVILLAMWYTFGHLGLSFLVAAIFATPG